MLGSLCCENTAERIFIIEKSAKRIGENLKLIQGMNTFVKQF